MQGFLDEIRRFKKVRMLGTAALMLAHVACGRVDAYAEDEIMLWDVAAGVALVKAAGGYVDVRPSTAMKWGRYVRCASHERIWKTA
jgi:myo-inositol-1(or 4)-monophosphatase